MKSNQTHLRIKAFLSGVFNRAKQVGAISGDNPLDNTKAGGTKKKFKGVAYMLNVIQDMLEKIPEPARTVCATAAFTGLSASELRGLRWTDHNGTRLTGEIWEGIGPQMDPNKNARRSKNSRRPHKH